MIAVAVMALVPVLAAAAPEVKVAPKLASPGLNVVNVDEKEGALFSEYFARQLETNGIQVTTGQEIAAVLGLERQKQLLGCADEASSCTAEIAGALGVDGVVTGTIGKVGSAFTVNLKIVNAKTASSMATYSERLPDEDHVFTFLAATAKDVAGKLIPKAPPQPVSMRELSWIPAVAGAGLVVAGIVSLGQAGKIHDEIVNAGPDKYPNATALDDRIAQGKTFDGAGIALIAVGGAALAGAGAMFALGGAHPNELAATETSVTASAFVAPGYATLAIGGTF